MTTCTACGSNVTGKKFCPQCGTAVQPLNVSTVTCPHCSGEVSPGAAFCMHCGASLKAQAASQPSTRSCPACQSVQSAQTAFCTNCGHTMQEAVAPPPPQPQYQPIQYSQPQYGQQNQYPQQYQQSQYGQSQYAQPQYGQPQYGQSQYPQPYAPPNSGGYQPQPMMGQAPLVLRCPTCMAIAPQGTPVCLGCRTNLAGVVPTPANVQGQGQQGGFLQGSGGNLAMGALGGAAAVIGGEMLLHGVENAMEGDRGYNHHHSHHNEGMLGDLGDLAKDVGLF